MYQPPPHFSLHEPVSPCVRNRPSCHSLPVIRAVAPLRLAVALTIAHSHRPVRSRCLRQYCSKAVDVAIGSHRSRSLDISTDRNRTRRDQRSPIIDVIASHAERRVHAVKLRLAWDLIAIEVIFHQRSVLKEQRASGMAKFRMHIDVA